MKAFLAWALTLACAVAVAAAAPLPVPPAPATIRVTGQAKVSEAPDRVYINIGVTTQAPKSTAAAAENATRLEAVITAIKRSAGSNVQLTTMQYSVTPDYRYPRDGAAPTITGYTARNGVRVRLDDLKRIGRVIDAATQAGSNQVQDIRFALKDEQAPRTEALREAALTARQDAQALAGALGLKIVRVLAVDEQGSGVVLPRYPLTRQFAAVAAAPTPTPVEAGSIDVNASVTLTVEVAPARPSR